ncbi:MAG: cofactor-independent phosphoglycerate mutase [Planctomycetota bacterium]
MSKYCIVIPDGAADYPVPELDDRTPLEVSRIPNIDRATAEGILGQVRTVPRRMDPGSDVAIMSVVGYDPHHYYTGRAPLEAVDMGVDLSEQQWGFRCNFITTDGSTLQDFCAGHISTEEAAELIDALNEELGNEHVSFHTGTGYRHLMVYESSSNLDLTTNPPHQVMGESLVDIFPEGRGRTELIELMRASRDVLEGHDVNAVRRDIGKNPANMIWLWGEGRRPAMESFEERYGYHGAAISAVNLVRGIARLVGWDIIQVPGITGYTDTDYAAKGRYAVDALDNYDIVLVHVEAPDEASHEQSPRGKVKAIEQVDEKIVGPIMAACEDFDEARMLVMPDHITSVEQGIHRRGLVPMVMWGEGINAGMESHFDERRAAETDIIWEEGHELMRSFLRD